MKIVFYNLNDQLEIDRTRFPIISNESTAVLIINYFGLMTLDSQISYLRNLSKNVIIIEDDVQAFYEFSNDILSSDYKFTSLRKTFACPDGGLVKSNQNLCSVTEVNKFHQYKLAGAILKSLQKPYYYDDEVFLHLLKEGESQIDEDIINGMSQISIEIISKIHIDYIAQIRQRNAKQIIEGLNELGVRTILPISRNKTPLFIPIWLKNRNKVREQMFLHNIFCPIHWPLEGIHLQKGAEMAKHEMSIIIDQRYNRKDMDLILEILNKSLK